jgi:hypothetical protein
VDENPYPPADSEIQNDAWAKKKKDLERKRFVHDDKVHNFRSSISVTEITLKQ